MKTVLRHKVLIVSAIVLLLLGLVNYLFVQPHILLFHYLNITLPYDLNLSTFQRHFLTCYFSDITWCAALCLAVVVLCELQLIRNNVTKVFILLLPFLTEAAQGFHFIRGTFDKYDMLCYAAVIFLLNLLFPTLISINMKMIKSQLWPTIVIAVFLGLAIASTPTKHYTYQKPKPQPCITHKPLLYSPVLVKINLDGNYTMEDLKEAQRTRPFYIINALNALTPNKYQLANGVTPNLTLNITLTTDSYQHYGSQVKGYVYDGDFYIPLDANYITLEKLYDDVANKVNWFITGGWCRNCPDPCVIK